MSEFSLETWIEAAPAQVFAIMTDPERAPEIMPNVTSVERLTPGAIEVGSRLRETRIVNGKPAETELTVRAYEPASRYTVSTEQSGLEVTYRYALRPERNGTYIQLKAEVQSNGLKKLMVPIVAGIMRREDGDHLLQLKQYVESQTA